MKKTITDQYGFFVYSKDTSEFIIPRYNSNKKSLIVKKYPYSMYSIVSRTENSQCIDCSKISYYKINR